MMNDKGWVTDSQCTIGVCLKVIAWEWKENELFFCWSHIANGMPKLMCVSWVDSFIIRWIIKDGGLWLCLWLRRNWLLCNCFWLGTCTCMCVCLTSPCSGVLGICSLVVPPFSFPHHEVSSWKSGIMKVKRCPQCCKKAEQKAPKNIRAAKKAISHFSLNHLCVCPHVNALQNKRTNGMHTTDSVQAFSLRILIENKCRTMLLAVLAFVWLQQNTHFIPQLLLFPNPQMTGKMVSIAPNCTLALSAWLAPDLTHAAFC